MVYIIKQRKLYTISNIGRAYPYSRLLGFVVHNTLVSKLRNLQSGIQNVTYQICIFHYVTENESETKSSI